MVGGQRVDPASETGEAPVPVLVVDDHAGFRHVVRAIFDEAPCRFDVRIVCTGEGALRFLSRQPPFREAPRPAFVVLDFRLPDMVAPEVLHRLRALPTLGDLPVLVLSAAGWDEDEARSMEAGAQDFQVKPSSAEALLGAIDRFWIRYVKWPRTSS